MTRALEAAGLSYVQVQGVSEHVPGLPAAAVLVLVTGGEGGPGPRSLRLDGITIDLESRVVDRRGTRLHLTRREWTLLEALAASDGRPVPAAELMARMGDCSGARGALYATVHRLRRKVEPDPGRPSWIVTIPGVGLQLRPPPP